MTSKTSKYNTQNYHNQEAAPASNIPNSDNPTASAENDEADEPTGLDRKAETVGFDCYKVEGGGGVGFDCYKEGETQFGWRSVPNRLGGTLGWRRVLTGSASLRSPTGLGFGLDLGLSPRCRDGRRSLSAIGCDHRGTATNEIRN